MTPEEHSWRFVLISLFIASLFVGLILYLAWLFISSPADFFRAVWETLQ
jgi:phosphotransferase system  glucose/maltose/N-acetylglucosamine-specific IIC component